MKGADQCPRCASRRWKDVHQDATTFYAETLRVCGNCGAAWEPFDPADAFDGDDPLSSFKHPCNNCAFRKGSPEQSDKENWDGMLLGMAGMGTPFYCHKGVVVAPAAEHGFEYPAGGKDGGKLRLCRGYLNSCVGPRLREDELA